MASQALAKGALWMQNVDFPASHDRALIDALYAAEGVINGFTVTPGGNLDIDVSAGRAVVQGDEIANQGKYLIDNDAVITLTLSSVGTGRTEYVYIAVNDSAVAGGRAGDNVTIETSTSPPPDSALLLATLTLPGGTSTITSGMIADSRVYADVVAPGSVTSAKIADGTIVTADIANGAVTSAKIADGTIATADIADGAITAAKIASGAIGTAFIADNSVTSAKIVDGTIATADLADGAVTTAKLSVTLQQLLDIIDPADNIILVAGATAPAGHVFCDGSAYSRTTYAATFARIGTVYGNGDGSTTFNVPDMRGRFAVGKGTDSWSDTLNEAGGSPDAVAVAHSHPHTHGIDHNHPAKATGGSSQDIVRRLSDANHSGFWTGVNTTPADSVLDVVPGDNSLVYKGMAVDYTTTHTHILDLDNFIGDSTQPEGASQSPTHSGVEANLPPYRTLNYCIRLR